MPRPLSLLISQLSVSVSGLPSPAKPVLSRAYLSLGLGGLRDLQLEADVRDAYD
jgi:hypothetical protein